MKVAGWLRPSCLMEGRLLAATVRRRQRWSSERARQAAPLHGPYDGGTTARRTYSVLLIPEPEGGYSIEVPALPGCVTHIWSA